MIFLICGIIQLATGIADLIAGITRPNFYQGLCGVIFLAWGITNLIIWHDERHDTIRRRTETIDSQLGQHLEDTL
ncbi:hypothetical protein JS533_007580 [Bifidobacterium amazonense]|uniref:Uncharacterized protein n=1 Tax=Bifidobacterium amazonense TaxID=2809027 RepID=A0ABS9VVM6_9BIFI|nr:hypothetical protein [Bifidobacterium amazonense]MCH9276129.1 hypothetical protein [Bifidobacterium amazonense]